MKKYKIFITIDSNRITRFRYLDKKIIEHAKKDNIKIIKQLVSGVIFYTYDITVKTNNVENVLDFVRNISEDFPIECISYKKLIF